MSFVRLSQLKNNNINAVNNGYHLPTDRPEDEVELRVQKELDLLREKIITDAQIAANESAQAELNPVKQELQRALSTIAEINNQLQDPLAQNEQYLADLILDIAFKLSYKIVGVHVIQDKAPLLNLVTELLDEIRTQCSFHRNIIIHLSPFDLAFIKSNLSEADISFAEDPNVETGGAIVELPPVNEDFLDKTIWDARLQSRFEILQNAAFLSTQARAE